MKRDALRICAKRDRFRKWHFKKFYFFVIFSLLRPGCFLHAALSAHIQRRTSSHQIPNKLGFYVDKKAASQLLHTFQRSNSCETIKHTLSLRSAQSVGNTEGPFSQKQRAHHFIFFFFSRCFSRVTTHSCGRNDAYSRQ